MKILLLAALLVSTTGVVCAQQSAYQDADGKTSIFLMKGNGNLTYNVSDSKFTVALVRIPDGNYDAGDGVGGWFKEKFVGGVNFFGKPDSDVTSQIFQSGSSPESIGGGGVAGVHGVFHKALNAAQFPAPDTTAKPAAKLKTAEFKDDWFLVNVNFTKSTFNTVASAATTPVTQHFNGFSVMPTYNAAYVIPHFNFLFGVSGGVSQVNNVDQLTQVSVQTTVAQSGAVSIVQSKNAYLGSYATAWNVPIYSDFVFIPKGLEWVGLDAFERSNVLKTDGYAEGGLGIFIAQPHNPTKVLGGVSVGWKNGDRTVSVVGGWSF